MQPESSNTRHKASTTTKVTSNGSARPAQMKIDLNSTPPTQTKIDSLLGELRTALQDNPTPWVFDHLVSITAGYVLALIASFVVYFFTGHNAVLLVVAAILASIPAMLKTYRRHRFTAQIIDRLQTHIAFLSPASAATMEQLGQQIAQQVSIGRRITLRADDSRKPFAVPKYLHALLHIPAHRDRPFRLNVTACSGLT